MGAGIVRIVTDASFERDVLNSGRLMLVAFGLPWCGPCKLLAPGLRALAARQKDRLTVAKLDADANPAAARSCRVESFPTSILFDAGREVERFDGYMPLRKLEAALRPYLQSS
ncbi:MAG: thioredoxin family protein [Sphingosinicella sp.]